MNTKNKRRHVIGIYPIIITLTFLAIIISYVTSHLREAYSFEQLTKDIADKKITTVYITPNEEVPTGVITAIDSDKKSHSFNCLDTVTVENYLRSVNIEAAEKRSSGSEVNDVKIIIGSVDKPGWFVSQCLPIIMMGIVLLLITFLILGNTSNQNAKLNNFGKSRAQLILPGPNAKKFSDVAGLIEEKAELEEVVDFLKDPGKYTKLGARIPKGIILVGPPGTGKTLLAKAVAGEAGVPFFSISGSDFVEMFVGIGAARVRDLFEDAKRKTPCIIFIDEIDAVARKRGAGLGGGHDEKEQTLNQLLVEMDGFGVNEGIIVMGATNRVDILDPAILRAGRFDRRVFVGKPDVKGREEILRVHAKNKPLGEDVDLKKVARSTAGFSGADLENLMNEAAINAAKENRAFIQGGDIQRGLIKLGIGTEKKSKILTEKDKKITAYHESGHAILFHVLEDVGPVHIVSIIPTGESAAGYTMPLPEKDDMFNSKHQMEHEIMVSLGGRIAEEMAFDDVTTGASQDIKQATELARSMVIRYGFSEEVGLVNYETNDDEVFIGKSIGHSKNFSEMVSTNIDKAVHGIIDKCYKEAKRIIEENKDVLEASANLLLDKERISGEEFAALFTNTNA
ncbi:MAG: ATP-dependent zinc metalloprotease FtsH [Lachnospiraceae bacterium]|nr:ATP-dependent zinc metalloprotease FtsH [Lachnospiraceae bacterium]